MDCEFYFGYPVLPEELPDDIETWRPAEPDEMLHYWVRDLEVNGLHHTAVLFCYTPDGRGVVKIRDGINEPLVYVDKTHLIPKTS